MMRITIAGLLLALCAGCALEPQAESAPASRPWVPPLPLTFSGLVLVPRDDLLDAAKRELTTFQQEGRHATALDDAAYAMQRSLRNLGYAHATVRFAMEPDEETVTQVVFTVDEGPRALLTGVAFEGNTTYPAERLATLFDVRPKDANPSEPSDPVEPIVFRQRDVDAGVSEIESFYLSDGFYRVKTGPARVTWDASLTQAQVVVPIVEGRRYVVAKVELQIEGDQTAHASLDGQLQTFTGRPYSVRLPAEAASSVREFLSAQGRLLMKISANAKVDDAAATATIRLRVRPGPQVRVSDLAVRGNDRTDARFILEQSALEVDQILTQERLDHAIDGLYSTGLFKTVKVEQKPGVVQDDVVTTDVDLAVEELEARIVDFEAGYGSYEMPRGAIRYRDRNLFGLGRVLEVVPSASLKGYGAEIKFFDNYIFGRSNTLEVTGGYFFREEPSFDSTLTRGEVAVRHRFDRMLSVRGGYRFQRSDASNLKVETSDATVGALGVSSSPFAQFEYDTRDNVFIPHHGLLVTAGLAWSTPAFGADLDYLETIASFATFFELGTGTVLALGVRGENREILDNLPDLPIQERFFLGGEHSVRSFYESELGPSDGDGHPLGGLLAAEATVELRQQIIGDLEGAVFYDIGTVNSQSFNLTGPFGHAVGVGLRYLLPFGPVRLDFGYNPGPRFAATSDWALHFSFGFSF